MKKSFSFVIILLILMSLFIPNSFGETFRHIELDFKNTDIQDVLRALASQEGVNIFIDPQISGNVTISLSKVSFIEAMNIITKNNGLTFIKANNTYYVKPIDNSSLKVEFNDGLLSVEANEIKLSQLWETIAQQSGVSLVPSPGLDKKFSIIIPATPLEDAIMTILSQSNCFIEKIGSVNLIKEKSTPQLPFTIIYQEELLTIDAKNIPLPVLCRSITEKTGISVVPDQNATQNVSIYLQNLNLTDSLGLLCETNGLLLHSEGAAWRITKTNGAFRVRVKDQLLSVDADNVDIAILVKEISRQTGQNIIVDREVRGAVTTHFQELPLQQGLTVLLENQGWMLEKQESYLYIRVNPNQNKNVRISYDPEKNLFDLDVQTAPVTILLNEMARRADLNLVILAQVNWTVNNLRLQKMSFTQVMDFLFKGTIFTYTMIDDTYLIGDGLVIRPETRDFAVVEIYPIKYLKADQLLSTLPPIFPRQNFTQLTEKNALIVSAPPVIHQLFTDYLHQVDTATIEDRTEIIKINYMKAEEVLKLIPASISKSDLVVIKEANAIAVTGPQNLINQVKSYIEKIDQVNPLIVFDILVLQMTDSNDLFWKAPNGIIELDNGREIYFNAGDGGVTLRDLTTAVANTSIATFQGQAGKAKILARPSITTLNGYPAKFDISTKRSYTITTITESNSGDNKTYTDTVKTYDSGLYVTITPWVSANNQITMEIKPKISEFGAAPEGSDLPTTTERSTETTVRAKDGETIIISGLKNTRTEKVVSKIPILGDIPLLGHLFKNTTVREAEDEFIIIITPHLIYDQPGKQLEDQISSFSLEAQAITKPNQADQIVTKPIESNQTVNQPNEPDQTVTKPNEPDQAVSQPNELDQAVSQPNERDQAVSQPNELDQAVSQPNERDQAVSQPNELNQAVSQPNELDQAVSQPNELDQAVTKPSDTGQEQPSQAKQLEPSNN